MNDGISVVGLSAAGGASVVISPGYIDITGNGNSIVNNGSIGIGSDHRQRGGNLQRQQRRERLGDADRESH